MSDLEKRIVQLSPEKRALLMARLAKKQAETLVQDGIAQRADQYSYPLSFGQQRMWFLDQLEAGSPLYSIPAALRLRGTLDVDALQRSLAEIVRRHEVLRSSYRTERGHPIQLIAPATDDDYGLSIVDLAALYPIEAEAEALRLAMAEAQLPFDLHEGALLRAKLLRLSDTDHVLLLTMHHIVSDGWSVGVLTDELTTLYTAFVQGDSATLPMLPIQYADFAAWQRAQLEGSLRQEQVAYWQNRLSDLPPLELPTDRPRPAVQGSAGAHYTLDLAVEVSSALRELSTQEDATLFMTLLAAFQALLYRYSGQEQFGIGTPLAGRTYPELEPLIGFFVNSLVICADLTGEPDFRTLLRRVRATVLEAMAHQDLPFEMLVESLHVERNLSRTPLFQVMFTLQSLPTRSVDLPGLSLEVLDVETGTAKFDLLLLLTETPQGLQASFEYNADLFDRATIMRMAGHFQQLLLSIVADPERPVSQLMLLTEAEYQQLSVGRSLIVSAPAGFTLHAWFEFQAARTPTAIAVSYRADDGLPGMAVQTATQLTYRELNERANCLAHMLRTMGVGPDQLVALYLERSADMIVAILGVLKAGGAYLPIDLVYPAERIAFMLEDAQPVALITQQTLLSVGEPGQQTGFPAHTLPVIVLDRDGDTIAQQPASNPTSLATPESLAYVIYTSGST
ncbi:MAG: AMP-binding protein, partial [Oscillochloris sp.]|nr:AMP-binding protein [Oscillochloris sp.]